MKKSFWRPPWWRDPNWVHPVEYDLDVPRWNVHLANMLTREIRVLLDEPTYQYLVSLACKQMQEKGIGRGQAGPVCRQILSDEARKNGAYEVKRSKREWKETPIRVAPERKVNYRRDKRKD